MTRNHEWERHATEAIAENSARLEEHSKRINAHDIQIAVIRTQIAIYAAVAGTIGGIIVSLVLKFWK